MYCIVNKCEKISRMNKKLFLYSCLRSVKYILHLLSVVCFEAAHAPFEPQKKREQPCTVTIFLPFIQQAAFITYIQGERSWIELPVYVFTLGQLWCVCSLLFFSCAGQFLRMARQKRPLSRFQRTITVSPIFHRSITLSHRLSSDHDVDDDDKKYFCLLTIR